MSHKPGKDVKDLRRSAMVNLFGNLLRAPHPVLLALVTQLYGDARWGIYVTGQAAVYLGARVCLMGLERAMTYWLPRSFHEGEVRGFWPALFRVSLASALLALLAFFFLGPWLATQWGVPEASQALRLMGLTTLPLAVSEFLIFTTVGCRKMEAMVFIRDALVPFSMVAAALLLGTLGFDQSGLGGSFLISHCVGTLAAALVCRRLLRGRKVIREFHLRLPKSLRRYTAPLWINELLATAIRRSDVLILAALATPGIVGVYGIVFLFTNVIRSMKGDFDGMVTAIASDISIGGAATEQTRSQLSDNFGYATSMVLMLQLPVAATFLFFSDWLLPLFGEGFGIGSGALSVLVLFTLGNSLFGLAGQIVTGIGGSRAAMSASIITMLVQASLLLWLVPRWGLLGAALAVGSASLLQGLVQLCQMRVFTGLWGLGKRWSFTVAWACISLIPGTLLVHLPTSSTLGIRVAACLCFAIPYFLGLSRVWRIKHALALQG